MVNAHAPAAQAYPFPVNGSLKIGTAFGIPIRLHWSFFLLVPFCFEQPLALPVVFLSVLLHELGHSLMARRFGIHVVDITFWPLGGMARMTNLPEKPKVEGLVAIAGPMVNFLLAGLTLGIFGISLFLVPERGELMNTLDAGAWYFLAINIALGTFNLLPAFPMDGGRILRAILACFTDWVTATERAVKAGRVASLGMVALAVAGALFYPPFTQMLCVTTIIALYLFFVGTQELMAVRVRHGQSPFGQPRTRGRDGPGSDPLRAHPGEAEWTVHPAPEPTVPTPPVGGARRPETWEETPPAHGFDEARVRELEQFRGRLRRYRDDE